MIRRDALWKGIIEDFFPEMMAWFYPEQVDVFDFSRVEFLDKELQELMPDSESSNRHADKLVKVGLFSGEARWILIHIEIQGYRDHSFEERMFRYYYRIFDRYNLRVEPLVILTDHHTGFHPRQYQVTGFKSQLSYQFFSYKLKDQPIESFGGTNPFAIVFRTAWEAIHQRNIQDETLLELKIQLFRNLLEAGYDKFTISRLSRFVRNYVSFRKPEMNQQLERHIDNLTHETMARGIIERVNEEYKRIGREEGLEEGMELNLQKNVRLLLKKGFSAEQVADLLEIPLKQVKNIQSQPPENTL